MGVRACSFVQNVKRFIVPTSVICHCIATASALRRVPYCASTRLMMSPVSIVGTLPYQAASTVR